MKRNIIKVLVFCFMLLSASAIFIGCSCDLNVKSGIEYILSEDGNNYIVDKFYESTVVAYDIKIPKYYKGKTVIGINNGAFSHSKNLVGIEIPNSIEYIGDRAFVGCNALTLVDIPESVKTIGEGAFSECYNLETVYLPDITVIKEYTFNKCRALRNISIPDTVKKIEKYAFYECSNIKDLTISDSVTEIGIDAFEPFLSGFNRYTNYNNVLYYGTENNRFMVASRILQDSENVVLEEGCLYVDSKFSDECKTTLKSVTFSSTVKEMGLYTFFNCRLLENVVLSDVIERIPEDTFMYCEGLKNLTFGQNLKVIPFNAFYYCDDMETMTFSNPEGWYFDPNDANCQIPLFEIDAEFLSDPTSACEYFYEYYNKFGINNDISRFTKIPEESEYYQFHNK